MACGSELETGSQRVRCPLAIRTDDHQATLHVFGEMRILTDALDSSAARFLGLECLAEPSQQ